MTPTLVDACFYNTIFMFLKMVYTKSEQNHRALGTYTDL